MQYHVEERVYIKNSLGQQLVGILNSPGEKCPLVIDCHGFTSYKDEHFHPALGRELCNRGISCFRFDFTGCGESEGEFYEGTVRQMRDDLDRVIEHFSKYEILGLCGHSLGSAIIAGAAKNSRVKAMAFLSPGIQYKKATNPQLISRYFQLRFKGYIMYKKGRNDYKITRDCLDQLRAVDMFSLMAGVQQPKLIIFGSNDTVGSTNASRQKIILSAKEPKEFEIIPGADHNFSSKSHKERVVNQVAEFFSRQLH